MAYVRDTRKTTMVATDMGSVDTAIASVPLESISSLKGAKNNTQGFYGKGVFALNKSKSMIYQLALLVM